VIFFLWCHKKLNKFPSAKNSFPFQNFFSVNHSCDSWITPKQSRLKISFQLENISFFFFLLVQINSTPQRRIINGNEKPTGTRHAARNRIIIGQDKQIDDGHGALKIPAQVRGPTQRNYFNI